MNGLQKFYTGLWLIFALSTAVLFVSGNMTMMALSVLGFASFGLIFMGMMCVLPTMVTHPGVSSNEPGVANRAKSTARRFVNAWSHPVGVELDRPRLH